eukprot:scaffold73205_cov22-Tisochrysis_lutea.AAC.1
MELTSLVLLVKASCPVQHKLRTENMQATIGKEWKKQKLAHLLFLLYPEGPYRPCGIRAPTSCRGPGARGSPKVGGQL